MKVKIVVDGGCDISKEKLEELDIEMLPIFVSNENQVFDDGELSIEDMFLRMRAGETFMTSQVSTQIYIDTFEKYASEGIETVYIALSSGISSTCDSAKVVATEVNSKYGEKIHVFDSKLATMGLGYMAEKAAEIAKKGANVNQILKLLEFYKNNLKQDFSVTSLEFLMRGGRVSRGEALIGGLLNIRPMLRIVPENGKLEVQDKARGDKAMIKKFLERLKPEFVNQTIIIGYGDSDEYAQNMKNAIIKQFNIEPNLIRIEPIGPVIGAHVGPEFIVVNHIDADESSLELD